MKSVAVRQPANQTRIGGQWYHRVPLNTAKVINTKHGEEIVIDT